MTWVKLDDAYYDHPKIARLSEYAELLWVRALAYCNRNETDGFVPTSIATRLSPNGTDNLVSELVDAGLWVIVEGGYRVHDYHDYQPSREELERRRASDTMRQRRHRGQKRESESLPVTPPVTDLSHRDIVTCPPHPGPVPKSLLSSSNCESSSDPPPVDDDEGPSRERIDAVLELVASERTRTTPGVRNPRQYARTVLAELRQTDTLNVRRLIVEHPGAPDPAIARHLCGDPHALDRWRPDRHCQRCDDTGWIPIDDHTSDRCPDCTTTSEARTA